MSSCKPLYRYIFHGTRLNAEPESQQFLEQLNLNTANDWASFNEGQILSQGTTTCLKVTLPSNKSTVYFKRYKYTKNPWEFFLRRSKAANELLNYQRFHDLGIPTIEAIALYEHRSFGRLNFACIVTKELKNTMQLDDFYTDVLLKMPKEECRRVLESLKKALFKQIQLAHGSGVFHLDLKWRNILIQKEGDQYTPIWIDCPRGVQRSFFNYRLKVADLSGLTRKALSFFSVSQLYRMIYLYLGKSATRADARKLFFDIKQHLERRSPKGFKH